MKKILITLAAISSMFLMACGNAVSVEPIECSDYTVKVYFGYEGAYMCHYDEYFDKADSTYVKDNCIPVDHACFTGI